MKPVTYFATLAEEVEYLRGRVKSAYNNLSVRPENKADGEAIRKAVRDDLRTYVSLLVEHERTEFFAAFAGKKR